MPNEETSPSIATRIKSHLKDAPFFCKILELILCVISTGLIVDPFNKIPVDDMNHVGVVFVGVCGYIVINGILILGHLLGEKVPKKTALMFSGVGAVLCCTAGLLLIREWTNFPNNLISKYLEQYSDQIVTSGFFAVLASIVFAIDIYFLNKYY